MSGWQNTFSLNFVQRRHFLCLNVLKLSAGAGLWLITLAGPGPCASQSQYCAWPPMWPQMSHQEAIIWCPVVWYFNYHNCWSLLLPSIVHCPVSALDGAYKGVGLSINNQNWRESVWFMTEHGATWQGSVLTWRMPSLPCHERPHRRDDVTWWPSNDLSPLMIQMTLRYSSRPSLIRGQLARVHSNISICLTDFMCLYGPITLCSAKT